MHFGKKWLACNLESPAQSSGGVNFTMRIS
jgi:hypothetical protein